MLISKAGGLICFGYSRVADFEAFLVSSVAHGFNDANYALAGMLKDDDDYKSLRTTARNSPNAEAQKKP